MLSFGGVIVGGTGKMPLTLVNGSPVQGAVVLDLTNHNEMSVELGRDAWSPEIYEHCPVQVIGQRGSERSIEAFSSERSIRRRSSIANQLFSPGSKYRITIMGNSKLPLTLSYKPTSVGSAIVPIGLLDSKGFPPPPQSRMARPIEATMSGLEPKLVLSDTLIDFGKRVVVRGSNVIPYSITLHMSSHSAEPIKFKFAVNEQCSPEDIGVFNIEPSEGVLAPETPLVLKVLFMPRESTSYNLRVPLYADGDMTSRYLELAVAGVGSMPR